MPAFIEFVSQIAASLFFGMTAYHVARQIGMPIWQKGFGFDVFDATDTGCSVSMGIWWMIQANDPDWGAADTWSFAIMLIAMIIIGKKAQKTVFGDNK